MKKRDFCIEVTLSVILFFVRAAATLTCCEASDGKPLHYVTQISNVLSRGPETIVDLQPFRRTASIRIKGPGSEEGSATLINLNPNINAWYLLVLNWQGGPSEAYHLENPKPESQMLMLDSGYSSGPVIVQGKNKFPCDLWVAPQESLKKAVRTGIPYASLCDGKLYLRNLTKGHRTSLEAVTDFLRDKVPGGEKIISTVRDSFFKYQYQKKAEEQTELAPREVTPGIKVYNRPSPALLGPGETKPIVKPDDLGIELDESARGGIVPGFWYGAKGNPGIYISVIMPNRISPEVMRSYSKVVNSLDGVESGGLVYLVAFDLNQFDLKFALGTDHPRVGWSAHIPDQMRDKNLPGPDGISTVSPLVSTGLINPVDSAKVAAAFTGGFKRVHGAFKYGTLSLINHGSHYGFIENGVQFSRLCPQLSTLYILDNGHIEMKTWTAKDDTLLPRIRYARQNGVPLIAGVDQVTGLSAPGDLVGRWGPGNWSGSEDTKLRTLRAGAGLQESRGSRFLIYAFFWSATPSAMARVFQAYGCRYAMHLDMNAPVHTYLAIYRRQDASIYVEHLIRQMGDADMTVKGQRVPRFLVTADDRDFFYMIRKEMR